MPNYTFRNKQTGHEWTETLSIAERETFITDNAEYIEQLIISAPALGDSVKLGYIKPDQGFRDVLREIKKSHPLGGGINTF
jgi:hypothetical protein